MSKLPFNALTTLLCSIAIGLLFSAPVVADNTSTVTDFDNDGFGDLVGYDPSFAQYILRGSSTGGFANIPLGSVGDYPAVGDFNGDGAGDLAAFNPSLLLWSVLLNGTSTPDSISFGQLGDVPVPSNYSTSSCTDLATYNPGTRLWRIRDCRDESIREEKVGTAGSVPVPADYDCDGRTDMATYDRSTREWTIKRSKNGATQTFNYGLFYDIPTPGDFFGRNCDQPALYRPTTKHFIVSETVRSGQAPTIATFFQWGLLGDLPRVINVDGDGRRDFSIFRPEDQSFYITASNGVFLQVPFAQAGSFLSPQSNLEGPFLGSAPSRSIVNNLADPAFVQAPRYRVRGDYNRDNTTEFTFARVDSSGFKTTFFNILSNGSVSSTVVNAPGDAVVPGDFNGDGQTQAAVVYVNGLLSPSTNLEWHISNPNGIEIVEAFGQNGDTPIVGDFDCDGKDDKAVVRDGTFLTWFIDTSSPSFGVVSKTFGLSGDKPYTADLDGDGCDELIVSRDNSGQITWYSQSFLTDSAFVFDQVDWGLSGDNLLTPNDMDGDGKADYIVARANAAGGVDTFIKRSAADDIAVPFGLTCDTVLSGTFSGAGLGELAVYRRSSGMIFQQLTNGAITQLALGNPSTDILVRPDGSVAQPTGGQVCGGGGGGGGGGGQFGCDVTTDFSDGGGGALWKPVSDNTRQPVFLLPAEYWDSADKGVNDIDVLDANGNVIANGSRRTCCPNGNRAHFDVRTSCQSLGPAPITIRMSLNGGTTECRTVPNPCSRFD